MADITNVDELFAAASDSGNHTIAGGTYDLTTKTGGGSDLNITGDWNLTVTGSGDIVIDGADTHTTQFENCDSEITGTESQRIIFTRGDTKTCRVIGDTSAASVVFNYCDLTEANGGNGLDIGSNPVASVLVECNNCRAYNNSLDGFSILTGNTNSQTVRMTLNDCEAYWNDNIDNAGTGSGGGAGDGATVHSDGQTLILNSGSYYQNGKSGVSAIGGQLLIDGPSFYENGQVVDTNGDVYAKDVGSLSITNCDFSKMDVSNVTRHIYVSTGVYAIFISRNTFSSPTDSESGYPIYVSSSDARILLISDNKFIDFTSTGGAYCVYANNTETNVIAENNTFYNCRNGIRAKSGIFMVNNIFDTINGYAVYDDTSDYDINPSNGYNCFYNCLHESNGDGVRDTDLSVDPSLDSNYKPTNSQVLTGGKPDVNGNATSIGAIQKQVTSTGIFIQGG